jgi:DNA polymerase elongation subunit (family B)
MYRNCVYSPKEKSIFLWTWDSKGNRIKEEIDFNPYILLEDKNGKDRSIYGTSLKKKEFGTSWDRSKFIKDGNFRRIYENLPPYQQFLIDNYWMQCEGDDFAKYPLKNCFLDIECPLPSGFPDLDTANATINLLTAYNNFDKKYMVFGLKKYTPTRPDVEYKHCKSEDDLLKSFIGYFSSEGFDNIVGWNSNGFDIPYLINRITFQLGKEWADELSPIGRIYEKINNKGKYGQPTKEYVIEGVSCLDYLIMYQKFKMEKEDSYKLDNIAEIELDRHKVDYDGTLWDLAKDDWDNYVNYNIVDVELIVELDEKLGYIELLRFLAYTGLCNLEKAIQTVPAMNGAIAIQARKRGEYIPTFVKPISDYKAPGGYVSEPKKGYVDNLVTFDANSLYPSVMISLNLSPETKIGKVEKIGDMIYLHHTSGRVFEFNNANFSKYLAEEKACLTKAGFLFSQKTKGIVPEFLDNLYSKRKEMKGKMLEAKRIGNKDDVQKYDTIQYAYKIHLNSLYGYMLEKYAPMGDADIGTSVTLTGQAAIKKSAELYKEYLRKRIPNITEGEISNSYRYSDTDSLFVSLNWIDKVEINFLVDGKITGDFISECESIENYINSGMKEWAIKSLRSKDPRFVFKRETICDSGIMIGKKYYVLHVLDDEGNPVDKFKYKGVDVVKTTMPRAIKPYVKKVIEHMIISRSFKETNVLFMEAYEKFKQLGIVEIAKNSGMNNFEKYSEKCDGNKTAKGMPAHLKAAYMHDYIIKSLGLESKYPKFKSGDKIKMVAVKVPNRYNIKTIGFSSKYPKEFEDIFIVDYELMFDKVFYEAIDRFYDAVNWTLRKPNENLKVELDDIFGED